MTRAQRYPSGDRAQLTQRHPPGSLQQMHAARRGTRRLALSGLRGPRSSSVGFFVSEENSEHLHRLRRMNGFENDAIPARYLAIVAFVVLPLKRLYETAEGIFFERGNVVKHTLPSVGRYRFKLSCGAVVNVDDPNHAGVGRGSRTFPRASRVRRSSRERSLRWSV